MTIAEIFKSCAQEYRARARSYDSTGGSERFEYLAGYFERRASLEQGKVGDKLGDVTPCAALC